MRSLKFFVPEIQIHFKISLKSPGKRKILNISL